MLLYTTIVVPLSALSPRNNTLCNNYFYFSPCPSIKLQWHLDRHCFLLHLLSDSRVCPLDSSSTYSTSGAWCCDVLSCISYCCNSRNVMSPLGTLSCGDPDCFSVQRNHLPFVSVFGERLSRKSNTVILFSIWFSRRSIAAVQTTLVNPVATRSWTISITICSVLKVATNVAASTIRVSCIGVTFFWTFLFVWFLLSLPMPLGRHYR